LHILKNFVVGFHRLHRAREERSLTSEMHLQPRPLSSVPATQQQVYRGLYTSYGFLPDKDQIPQKDKKPGKLFFERPRSAHVLGSSKSAHENVSNSQQQLRIAMGMANSGGRAEFFGTERGPPEFSSSSNRPGSSGIESGNNDNNANSSSNNNAGSSSSNNANNSPPNPAVAAMENLKKLEADLKQSKELLGDAKLVSKGLAASNKQLKHEVADQAEQLKVRAWALAEKTAQLKDVQAESDKMCDEGEEALEVLRGECEQLHGACQEAQAEANEWERRWHEASIAMEDAQVIVMVMLRRGVGGCVGAWVWGRREGEMCFLGWGLVEALLALVIFISDTLFFAHFV
jgi:hypothetical protein